MAANDPASSRQLDYIKTLAFSRGVSFVPPANRLQASKLIDELKRRERSPAYEIAADREQTSALHGEHAPANSPHKDEITGYGSHAHWRNSRPQRRH
jgi:hypothetical protein